MRIFQARPHREYGAGRHRHRRRRQRPENRGAGQVHESRRPKSIREPVGAARAGGHEHGHRRTLAQCARVRVPDPRDKARDPRWLSEPGEALVHAGARRGWRGAGPARGERRVRGGREVCRAEQDSQSGHRAHCLLRGQRVIVCGSAVTIIAEARSQSLPARRRALREGSGGLGGRRVHRSPAGGGE